MVISNIGTIIMALPQSSTGRLSGQLIEGSPVADQVKILSISNTVSRIVFGPLADFVSPVEDLSRKPRINRFVFLSGSASLLSIIFLWMAVGVETRQQVWVLSFGTGIGYGVVFTVLPGIISSMWGMQNLARNFGIMMYAPFVGTPLFSYMYAFISESHYQKGESICYGRLCWQLTFRLSFVTSIIALLFSFILMQPRH